MTLRTNPMHPFLSPVVGGLALAGLCLLGACGSKPTDANAENFTAAMRTYLASRGDLCVGKTSWPIDVTAHDFETHARDALQMPVLEKLGLVTGSVAEIDRKDEDEVHHMKVQRYELTEAGRKYYLTRDMPRRDGTRAPQGDLCVARLTLDKVVSWDAHAAPQAGAAAGSTPADRLMVVNYTYKVEPVPWMNDPEAQKVFPVVANVLRNAGSAQLTESFRLGDAGWVAVDL